MTASDWFSNANSGFRQAEYAHDNANPFDGDDDEEEEETEEEDEEEDEFTC